MNKSSRKIWTHKELQSLFSDVKLCKTLADLTKMHNLNGYARTQSAISSCIDKHRHDTIICVEYDKRRGFKTFESKVLLNYIIDTIGEQSITSLCADDHTIEGIAAIFCRDPEMIIKQIKVMEEEINNERFNNPFNCNEATKNLQKEAEMNAEIPDEVEVFRIKSLVANIMLANPKVQYEEAETAATRIVRGDISSTNDMISNLYDIMNDDVKMMINKLKSAVEINVTHMAHRNMTIIIVHDK